MEGTLSEHMRVSLTVWMTAAFLAVIIGVLGFSLTVYYNYTGKYTNAMTDAVSGSIYDVSRLHYVSCPQAYASIMEQGAAVEYVRVKWLGSPDYVEIYTTRGGGFDNLMTLATGKNTTKFVRVEIDAATNNTMMGVTLTEVEAHK